MRNRPLRRCVVSAGGPSQLSFVNSETFHMLRCGRVRLLATYGVRLARWVARSELRRLPRAICICTVDWPTERTWKRKVPAQATDECANVWRSSFL